MFLRRFSRLNTALIVFAVGLGSLVAQTAQTASTSSADVEQRIQRIQNGILPPLVIQGGPAPPTLAERMTALRVPGVSIAVIRDGKIEWARGFGVMKTGGPPVTADTIFQAGSISKPVAAMAVLRLVQSGKLSLDTDVNQYLKSWKVPENQFTGKAKVTLRQLLTHTAGMTVHGFGGYASGAAVPSVVQVLNGQRPANSPAIFVDTVPGTAWRYSGGGYTIAQLLLEDVTGTPFPRLLRDTVLAPIGMTRSTYEQPLPKERMAEAATPYGQNGTAVAGGAHTYPEMAAAGLWTTASDLARYAIEVQEALAGKSNRVLSAAMTREMLTASLNGWGLGPQTGGSAARRYFTHGGADAGFQSNLLAYNSGDGVVVLTNSDSGGQLAAEILRTVAHVYEWPDFGAIVRSLSTSDPKAFDGYTGNYQGGAATVITREGDQLFAQVSGQQKLPLIPVGQREFVLTALNTLLTFETNNQGRATQIILRQNGLNRTATRLEDADAKRVKDQMPAPGSEAALRRSIGEIRTGKPEYDAMSLQVATVTRQQLPQLQAQVTKLGSLLSLTFLSVTPAGADIYRAEFENGAAECRILLGQDGKVEIFGIRPL